MSEYKMLNIVAYDHLRKMIYDGEFEFKKIYSETKLARALSISRTPMRDALNRLAQERYIDILPNRGFMLHTPTQADIVEAYHMRLMIEGYCAQVVARHYPDAQSRAAIDRMEDAMARQQALLEEGGDYSLSQFWMYDLTFHRALLDYMNISTLIAHYERFMHIFMPHHLIEDSDLHGMHPRTLERHRSTLVEHAAITEALKSHDEAKVVEAVRVHLDSGLRALYVSIED